MKILINFDIEDNRPGKALRIYDMRGNTVGKGEIVLDCSVSKEGTLFTPTVGYMTYQAELNDDIVKASIEPTKGNDTDTWRARYLSNSFIIPKASKEQWMLWVEEWSKNDAEGKIVFLPKSEQKIKLHPSDEIMTVNWTEEEIKILDKSSKPTIPPRGVTEGKKPVITIEDDIDDLFKDLIK